MTREDFTEHIVGAETIFYRDRDHRYFRAVEPVKRREPEGAWKGVEPLKGVSTVVKPFDWRPDGISR